MIKCCLQCKKDFSVRGKRGITAKYCSLNCKSIAWRGIDRPQFIHIKGVSSNTGKTHFKKGEHMNENNKNWKGNNASYSALHYWVIRRLGKPKMCEFCGDTESISYDWANKSHEYKRDVTDWIRLCRSCHHNYDHSRAKMWITRRKEQHVGALK